MKKFLAFTNKRSIKLLWSDYSKAPQLKKNPDFLCSISGGQDSVVVFFLIYYIVSVQKKNKENQISKSTIKILYFHHFWQLKNFFLPLFLFRFSFLFQTPYLLILPKFKYLSENQARNWRKKNFFRLSQVEKTSNLLTGHSQTDFIEKNLNNLFRGTTPKGLIDKKFFYQGKYQSFAFSDIFIKLNCISEKSHVFHKVKIFLDFETKLIKTEVAKNTVYLPEFLFLKKPSFNRQLFFFESTIGSSNNIQFKSHDFTFQKQLASSSFYFYSKQYFLNILLDKPLESFRRSIIFDLSTFFEFPLLIDLTNYSKNFSRNKIRHEIVPFIKIRHHQKIESALEKFFKIVGRNSQASEIETSQYYFLYKIVQIKRTQAKLLNKWNQKLNKKINSSFLQKLIVDSKNIELTFSQLILLQKKIVARKN